MDDVTINDIERKILEVLIAKGKMEINDIAQGVNLNVDQVRRGVEWLKYKKLIEVTEVSSKSIILGRNGVIYSSSGLPERRLVEAIARGKNDYQDIITSGILSRNEISPAIAAAKRNHWIKILKNETQKRTVFELSADLSLSNEEKLVQKLSLGEIATSKLSESELETLEVLRSRPEIINEKEDKNSFISILDSGRVALEDSANEQKMEKRITPEIIITGRWKESKFTSIDVQAPAPRIFPGRTHPLVDFIDEVKEIFIGLGFNEIEGNLLQSSFWNFDALFTPQDHPAREMQDTFYISNVDDPLNGDNERIKAISNVHNSQWGYRWDIDLARKVVLRTHTTPVTLKYLADTKPDSARLFSIGRVFRNEKVSYKHLVEFTQVEGVALGENLSLRNLMGLQKEFYLKMGIKKVKFWPTFFPYTEPSLQSMVYNEKLNKWIELFGMGIFRPEVTVPLNIKGRVLAWGGGLERIAMLRFGLQDVREIYMNKLSWLRSAAKCQL